MGLRITGTRESLDPYYVQALEAALSDKEIDIICTALGHPRTCPSGKPIPRGRCCKEGWVFTKPAILPVSALGPGDKGKVLLVRNMEPERLESLGRLGILPGAKVTVISKKPSYVLRVGMFDVAMEQDVAQDVFLLVDPSKPKKGYNITS